MSRYSRPLFKIIFFILLIIVSVMVVHTLLPFIQITNRVMSTMIETGIIMIASCPFLFIIYSQHRDWAASEQRLFSLFEKNSALICEFNLEGKLLDANSKLMEVTGFTLQELRNKSYKMLIINEQIFSFEEFFEKAKKGERLNFEVTIKHKSGSFIDLGLKSVPILTGNQITSLFFIAKDITEQKKSLEQLNLVKNQLESFVNHASVAICIFDFKGRLLQVNQAFEQLFGWDKLELIGRRFPGIPHYLVPSLQIIHNKVRKKEQVTNFETVRLRKDGSEIYVNLSFSTVLDTAGNVVALAAFIRDITESKKAEEMLLKSEKLSVAGQLAAGVAHEIRNPLTTLRGFVQLMMTTSLDHGKYLEIMLSELDRINLIVGEFLILSRPHLRQSTIKDLGTIMSQVVALLEPQAMLSNVRIQ
ncbi:MAG TPA: PAS domain S-box protein, partial [Bacillota bacterium]|nr:PAS domain S-box protein [Bacillota bacterium]